MHQSRGYEDIPLLSAAVVWLLLAELVDVSCRKERKKNTLSNMFWSLRHYSVGLLHHTGPLFYTREEAMRNKLQCSHTYTWM